MEILKVVVIGVVLVFLILVLLTLVLVLFRKVMGVGRKEKSGKKNIEATAENKNEFQNISSMCEADTDKKDENDLSVICAITAAIEAYRAGNGEKGNFRVIAFRKTQQRRRTI